MRSPDHQSILTPAERIGIALVFLIAIVVSVVVVSRIVATGGEVVGPSEDRPMVADSVPRPVSLDDGYQVAMEWAREWNTDAWPILISSQFEYQMIDGEPGEDARQGMLMYTFAAPQDGHEWPRLTLAVGRQSGMIYFEDEVRSEVEPPESIEALLTELPVSVEQAFRLAEEVVGEGYREGCAEHRRTVQVVLDATDRDAPTWVVVYYDQRDRTTNDIVMRIDALSGATSTEERDDPSCDMPS